MLAPGTYLTDWRGGLFIVSTYLDIQPQYRGFGCRGIKFIFGGSYGLYIDSAYLRSFGGLITSRIFQHTGDVFIVAENSGDSVFYSGNVMM